MMMNANNTTSQAKAKARRREEMIARAREIRGEFAKIHLEMGKILARAQSKKAA